MFKRATSLLSFVLLIGNSVSWADAPIEESSLIKNLFPKKTAYVFKKAIFDGVTEGNESCLIFVTAKSARGFIGADFDGNLDPGKVFDSSVITNQVAFYDSEGFKDFVATLDQDTEETFEAQSWLADGHHHIKISSLGGLPVSESIKDGNFSIQMKTTVGNQEINKISCKIVSAQYLLDNVHLDESGSYPNLIVSP